MNKIKERGGGGGGGRPKKKITLGF